MPYLGSTSSAITKTCHPDLQKVIRKAILKYNFSVTEGYRGEEEQNAHFRAGRSKLKYPESKHNRQPSEAAHLVPYPAMWPDTFKAMARTVPAINSFPDREAYVREHVKRYARFYMLAQVVMDTAKELNVEIRGGFDWDKDGDIMDQTFDDLSHFELV